MKLILGFWVRIACKVCAIVLSAVLSRPESNSSNITNDKKEYDITDFIDYNKFFYSLKEEFIYNVLILYTQDDFFNKYNFIYLCQ